MLVRMSVYLVAIVSGSESVCDVLTICYGSYAEHPLSKFLFTPQSALNSKVGNGRMD